MLRRGPSMVRSPRHGASPPSLEGFRCPRALSPILIAFICHFSRIAYIRWLSVLIIREIAKSGRICGTMSLRGKHLSSRESDTMKSPRYALTDPLRQGRSAPAEKVLKLGTVGRLWNADRRCHRPGP